jgi:uncharacterized RDD family membrane protein YckC
VTLADLVFPTDERDERPAATVPAGLLLASIARRAVGTILDQLLVFLPVALVVVVRGYRLGDTVSDDMVLALNIAAAAVALCYETTMVALLGRTVGKFVTGTRVVRQSDGGEVGWVSAGQRALVPVVASAVPQIGWILGAGVYGMALLGPLRQGLHDRAAGTLVVLNGARATEL